MLYFWKTGGPRISIWHFHVSILFKLGPSPFNSFPHWSKKLFTSSFQVKFLKIRFTIVDGKCSILFPQCQQVPGHIWATAGHTSNAPQRAQKWQNMHFGNFRINLPGLKLKIKWGEKTSTFHEERPVQRYGRLKLKFLWEWFSHIVFIAFVQLN